MTATTPPPLPADLNEGLKRLKMAAMRRLAPELLVTAKTQRWKPEEFLRTLVEAEIASRDASNARTRLRQAAFPVTKTLEEFDVAASSIPPATFDYLASLEWIRAAENVCMIGPAGTGKSHTLIALGIARCRPRGVRVVTGMPLWFGHRVHRRFDTSDTALDVALDRDDMTDDVTCRPALARRRPIPGVRRSEASHVIEAVEGSGVHAQLLAHGVIVGEV